VTGAGDGALGKSVWAVSPTKAASSDRSFWRYGANWEKAFDEVSGAEIIAFAYTWPSKFEARIATA